MYNLLTNYAKLVPQYAYIATLFYNLLKKTTKLCWIIDYDTAFKQFKHALIHAPVLAMPNFDDNIVVDIDTCDVAVGVMLMQYDWPVAFTSKGLNSAQYNYHTMYCELLLACKK